MPACAVGQGGGGRRSTAAPAGGSSATPTGSEEPQDGRAYELVRADHDCAGGIPAQRNTAATGRAGTASTRRHGTGEFTIAGWPGECHYSEPDDKGDRRSPSSAP